MFYSQLILAKKGPLGTIWIAAHLERKLRKNQVTETNISVSVGKCAPNSFKAWKPNVGESSLCKLLLVTHLEVSLQSCNQKNV